MKMKEIKIKDKTYQLKFGLRSLINLSKIPNINVDDNLFTILFEGLKTCQPQVEYNLLFSLNLQETKKAKEVINEIFSPNDLPSPQTIEEWFRVGIGQLRLPLSDFYCLTPKELELAYQGYSQHMMDVGNIISIAIRKAFDENSEPFIAASPTETREQVFQHLNILQEE